MEKVTDYKLFQDDMLIKDEQMRYLEVGLPLYLQHDINEIKKGEQPYDCLWCELYGSINSAFYDDEITEEQAVYLRKKYLNI